MKRSYTLLVIFISLAVSGQTTMNIYENNGSSQQVPLSSIDSITYTVSSQATMNIYEDNGSSQQIPLSSIDSITYTLGNAGNLATITTLPVDSITSISAVSGGNITNDGGTTITSRGMCWNTSPNPTISNNITSDAAGTGSFTSELTGLQASTTYYVCAYATNSAGTAYGTQQSFTTAMQLVTTDSIANITNTTAYGYLHVFTGYWGGNVTFEGFCWDTMPNPTVSDSNFSCTCSNFSEPVITGLTASTTYYVRAFAGFTIAGLIYGNQLSFTTNGITITTDTITNNTGTTATSGGSISNDGGAPIIARGVCWGTTPNPSITNSHTNNGFGTGSFTSSMTSLTPLTTYYVRAYATNSFGTAYGNQIIFTAGAIPTLTTNSITKITATTATGGGDVTNDGGEPVSAFGICWSTSQNPTVDGNITTDGSGTGSFTSSITGLSASTTYYVRAYATNSLGTAYGDQVSFTTTAPLLTAGQNYQGGIIAYILQPGDPGYDANVQHGLIIAPSDQALNALWYNGSYTVTGATGTAIGTGAANTAKIIASQGSGTYAASICMSLNIGGYTDWYLPSLNELSMVALWLDDSNYWSSTEYTSGTAYQVSQYGTQGVSTKSTYESVRAVRSF